MQQVNYEELEGLMNDMSLQESVPFYNINQDLKIDDFYWITEINMNFYQVWSIFRGILPNIKEMEKGGDKYYEYIFESEENNIFIIYGYGSSFLTVKDWCIGSSTKDKAKVQHFLENLYNALECYANGYKGMEQLNFNSNNPKIRLIMQEVRYSLLENREILKSI